jgi:hypothetical protein
MNYAAEKSSLNKVRKATFSRNMIKIRARDEKKRIINTNNNRIGGIKRSVRVKNCIKNGDKQTHLLVCITEVKSLEHS